MTTTQPTANKLTEQELPKVLNAIIKHCAAYGQPARKFLLDVLKDFETQSYQSGLTAGREEIKTIIKYFKEKSGDPLLDYYGDEKHQAIGYQTALDDIFEVL